MCSFFDLVHFPSVLNVYNVLFSYHVQCQASSYMLDTELSFLIQYKAIVARVIDVAHWPLVYNNCNATISSIIMFLSILNFI